MVSSQNVFPGLETRPTMQIGNSQPSWVNLQAQPISRFQQQQPTPSYPDNPQPSYGARLPASLLPGCGQWSESQTDSENDGNCGYTQGGGRHSPCAPQFGPYVLPSQSDFVQLSQQQPQSLSPSLARLRGFAPSRYIAQQQPHSSQQLQSSLTFAQQQCRDNELSVADWADSHNTLGHKPNRQYDDSQLGFGQPGGGELGSVFNDEEHHKDGEDGPRSDHLLMIAAALVGAIVIGGSIACAYTKFSGDVTERNAPIVKSDGFAVKSKPADAGGKQFPYSDTKIMGRLGESISSASADELSSPSKGSDVGTSNGVSLQDADNPRKASTLVIGRDGTAADSGDAPASLKKKYKNSARTEPLTETDMAADASPVTTRSGTDFVAVLASIPHSSSSRIDTLKQFADMQQKYSTVLVGKTLNIASTNLSKGVYDRLVVGPPASREEAISVCVQLKAQGYHGCWVTSY